ncbi:MAG: sugar-binding protein [Gammaproteobacteria bacterium]
MRRKGAETARAGLLLALIGFATAAWSAPTHAPGRSEYRAPEAASAPIVDGIASEKAWLQAPWQEIEHRWLGPEVADSDFRGRFKVVWTETRIYVLAEIVDDVLYDGHRDPLVQYWDDDCLEIFVDEDYSGGDHQYNHNAFAYHVALDNQAVDIGVDRLPRDYSHHVESRWRQTGDRIVWELAIDIYDDGYVDGGEDNVPVRLSAGKVMGLMVAYCDNDGSPLRENFMGSEAVLDGKKDRGWIDAGLFGALILMGGG